MSAFPQVTYVNKSGLPQELQEAYYIQYMQYIHMYKYIQDTESSSLHATNQTKALHTGMKGVADRNCSLVEVCETAPPCRVR